MDFFFASLATSVISITIGKGKIFKGFRDYFEFRSAWLSALLNCPYCLSHWIGFVFGIYLLISWRALAAAGLLGSVMVCFAVVGGANVFSFFILSAIEKMNAL